jgi:hypothetical protein
MNTMLLQGFTLPTSRAIKRDDDDNDLPLAATAGDDEGDDNNATLHRTLPTSRAIPESPLHLDDNNAVRCRIDGRVLPVIAPAP